MNLKKIMLIFGTRPEAIKMAPVIKELKGHSSKVKVIVVVTAQHREMLDQILELLDITVDYDLNIMKSNQTLFSITSTSLMQFETIFKEETPDIILVQGDTTTGFVASLAAYFLKIPVGHIEAGLRTHDKYNPFPEEMNRRLTGALSDLHFVPTMTAYENLVRENVNNDAIVITGNTVIDTLLMTVKNDYDFGAIEDKKLAKKLSDINFDKKLILVTAHRRESFGKPLENICSAVKELAENNDNIEIVYPVHMNPNVQEPVNKILGDTERIHLTPPLDYELFIHLMNKSFLILTDSGGIQEEAPSLGKPVLVMRTVTERPEAIKAGTVKLIGTDKCSIVSEAQKLLDSSVEYEKMARAVNPYGDGIAAKRISNCLLGLPFEEFRPATLEISV
jgi:UDP-N-acetylglucosamine 2-epimerase